MRGFLPIRCMAASHVEVLASGQTPFGLAKGQDRGRNLHRTEIWVPTAFILQDCLRWLTHSSAKRALRHGCIIILSRHGDQKTAHLSLWEILMCCMCCTPLAEPRSSFCGSGPRGPECDSQHIEVLHTQTHTSYIPCCGTSK